MQLQTGTLRILAHEAYQQSEVEREAIKTRERLNLQQAINSQLHSLFNAPITTTLTEQNYDGCPVIEADDLRFTRKSFGDLGTELVLLDVCPACSKEVHSDGLRTLSDLGQLLHQFVPGTDHNC